MSRPLIIALGIAAPFVVFSAVSALPLQSLSQLGKSAPKSVTAAERSATLKRLSNSDTPPAMGGTTTVTPSVPVRDGIALGYFNAVAVVTAKGGGAAALQGGSASAAGAVTLEFPVTAQKAYLIDCALDQYNQLAWSATVNGTALSSGTGQVMGGHLSVLTSVLKTGGAFYFSASPPPGSGSQYLILTSCSVTVVG